MKFNFKDIDWKQFLLQRGEWLGVGIALAITLPVFFIGVKKALFSGSAKANAAEVASLTTTAKNNIAKSVPDADTDKPPAESNVQISFAAAEPEKFATDEPWFVPSKIEDTKRRRPEVLSLNDAQLTFQEIGARINLIHANKSGPTQVEVIRIQQATQDPRTAKALKKLQDRLRKLGMSNVMGGMMGGMGGGGGGMRGMAGGMGGMGGMQGMMMQGGMGGMGGMGGGMRGGMQGMPMAGGIQGQVAGLQSRNATKKIGLMDLDKLKDDNSVRLAEELLPIRMVMVTASFPFKKQLEAFRVALRMRTLNDLVSNLNKDDVKWQFLSPEIERRVLHPDGRVKTDWEKNYDKTMLRALTALLAVAVEADEDQELKDWKAQNTFLVNEGLVWARPPMDPELGSKYPKVEVASFKESVDKLRKLSSEGANVKVPSQLERRFKREGIDATNPFAPVGGEDTNANQPGDAGDKKPDIKEEDELAVPDNTLVRFFDLTVQPGFTYEYRVRVRMANPNFRQDKHVAYPSLAKDKEIVGDWTALPPIAVPHDVFWYVLDEKPDRERATVQIHRWLDVVDVSRDQSLPVADWSVLEKAPAYRGEYLGRPTLMKVPTWDKLDETYKLAHDPKTKRMTTLPVDFTVRVPTKQFPALLIDFEGGKTAPVRFGNKNITEETPVQVLVLSPEGRLLVRSSVDDVNDPERGPRVDAWKKRIEEVERGIKGGQRGVAPGQGLFDKSSLPGGRPGGK